MTLEQAWDKARSMAEETGRAAILVELPCGNHEAYSVDYDGEVEGEYAGVVMAVRQK